MEKFYPKDHLINQLKIFQNNTETLSRKLKELQSHARGRILVLPPIKGGFIQKVLRDFQVETAASWDEFNTLREDALNKVGNRATKRRRVGKTARKRASETAGKNPTNVPGNGPAKGATGSKPEQASNSKKAAKRKRKQEQKKK